MSNEKMLKWQFSKQRLMNTYCIDKRLKNKRMNGYRSKTRTPKSWKIGNVEQAKFQKCHILKKLKFQISQNPESQGSKSPKFRKAKFRKSHNPKNQNFELDKILKAKIPKKQDFKKAIIPKNQNFELAKIRKGQNHKKKITFRTGHNPEKINT